MNKPIKEEKWDCVKCGMAFYGIPDGLGLYRPLCFKCDENSKRKYKKVSHNIEESDISHEDHNDCRSIILYHFPRYRDIEATGKLSSILMDIFENRIEPK